MTQGALLRAGRSGGRPLEGRLEIPVGTGITVLDPAGDYAGEGYYTDIGPTPFGFEAVADLGAYLEGTAGKNGQAKSSSYGRKVINLPASKGFAANTHFEIECDVLHPSNFQTVRTSYGRSLWTVDNTETFAPWLGQNIGCISSGPTNEARIAFEWYSSDNKLRLVAEHENNSGIVLWRSPNNAVSLNTRHVFKVTFDMAKGLTGGYSVEMDGAPAPCDTGYFASRSGIQTMPSSLADIELWMTRVRYLMDGWANQNAALKVQNFGSTFTCDI